MSSAIGVTISQHMKGIAKKVLDAQKASKSTKVVLTPILPTNISVQVPTSVLPLKKLVKKTNPVPTFIVKCAIDNYSGNLIPRSEGVSGGSYSCPECGEYVIFCNGPSRGPYFKHWRSYGCSYYS